MNELSTADIRLIEWAEWSRKNPGVLGYPKECLEHKIIHGKGATQDATGYIPEDIEDVEKEVLLLPQNLRTIIEAHYIDRYSIPDQRKIYAKKHGSVSESIYYRLKREALSRIDHGLVSRETVQTYKNV